MGKKKKNLQQRNVRSEQNNTVTTTIIIVAVSILVIGLGIFYAMSPKDSVSTGSAVSSTGGDSITSLESQVQSLTAQIKADPKNASLHENLGTTLFSLANAYRDSNDSRANETYNKTIEAYNETLKLEPESKETLGDLATAYFYTNQVDKAISTVEKALKLDPDFLPALMNYGIYLANGKGDYEKAVQQWEKIPYGSPQYDQAQSLIKQYKK